MEKEGGQLINVSQIHQTDIFQGFCFYHFVLPKVPFVTLIFDFQSTCNFLFTINSKFSHPCLPIRIYLWSSLYPFFPFIPFFILLSLPLHPDLSLVLLLQPCSLVLAIKSRLPEFLKQTTHLNIKCNYLAVIISQPHVYV